MPSNNDLETTRGLAQAAETMELKLIDHLIVTEHNTYSITESQLIDHQPPRRGSHGGHARNDTDNS